MVLLCHLVLVALIAALAAYAAKHGPDEAFELLVEVTALGCVGMLALVTTAIVVWFWIHHGIN